jgi:hypothetical protein
MSEEIKKLREREDNIEKEINKREKRDMNKFCLKFIIDMLNLVFGKSEETEIFWENHLIPEVVKKFKLHEAMKIQSFQESVDVLIKKKTVNLNSLFYSFIYLFGLEPVNPNNDPNQSKLEEYFSKFKRDERPFGMPKTEYDNFKIVARSKTYGLRNVPYKQICDEMYKNAKE